MTAAWMLYVLLVGTLLACAALAADVALRRTGVPTRWVWVAALAGSVALAVFAPRGQAPVAFKIPSANVMEVAEVPAVQARSIAAYVLALSRAIDGGIARGIATIELRISERLAVPLAVIWGVLSAGMFVLLVIVNRRVNRARRSWPVEHMYGSMVRVAPHTGPAVIGLARPEIVVPQWLLERTDEERRLVVVHEREHVNARDQLVLIGAWCAVALLPWHPAVWWMLSRLRLAIELDCDARVLYQGVQPRPYGALLIDIAGQCAGLRVGALALADKTTHLERRLLAMKPTRSRFSAMRIGVLGSFAALATLIACEARMPTSAEIASMDASSAVKLAQESKLIDAGAKRVVYIVDGVVTPASVANAIAPDRIVSVNVWKSPTSAPSQIGIVTKDAKSVPASERAPAPPAGYVAVKVKQADGALVTVDSLGSSAKLLSRVNAGEVTAVRVIADTVVARGKGLMLKSSSTGAQPLVIIDGVLTSQTQIGKLNTEDIESIEVLKGPSAVVKYGPDATNGVITVKTKKGATP